MMNTRRMAFWLLLGLALCYAYDRHVYQTCLDTGRTPAACLALMGNI